MISLPQLPPELSANNQVDLFSKDGWQVCSAKSLRGHIVNAHFRAGTLARIGVPLYDIEIAEVRHIGLGWVVKRAFEKISREDDDIQAEIDDHRVSSTLEVADYRLRLVKSIRIIADRSLALVPWDKIDAVYRGASRVPVDLAVDTTDVSFKETAWEEYQKLTSAFGAGILSTIDPRRLPAIKSIDDPSLSTDRAYLVNI